jgi:hypothetical protein
MADNTQSKKRTVAGAAVGAAAGQTALATGNAGMSYSLGRRVGLGHQESAKMAGRSFGHTFNPVSQAKGFRYIATHPGVPTKGKVLAGAVMAGPALVGAGIGAAASRKKVQKNAFGVVSKGRKKQAAATAAGAAGGVAAGHAVTSGVFAHKAGPAMGMSKPEAFRMAYSPKGGKGLWDLAGMMNQPKLKYGYRAAIVAPAVVGGAAGAAAGARLARPKKTVKKNYGGDTMISAFGVNHGEEVSKISFTPVVNAFKGAAKAMKFGNASSVPKAIGAGWKRGGMNAAAQGSGPIKAFGQKTLKAAEYGYRRSPGTALATAGVGGAAVAAPGYKKN